MKEKKYSPPPVCCQICGRREDIHGYEYDQPYRHYFVAPSPPPRCARCGKHPDDTGHKISPLGTTFDHYYDPPAAPPRVGDRLAGYPCVSHEEAHPSPPPHIHYTLPNGERVCRAGKEESVCTQDFDSTSPPPVEERAPDERGQMRDSAWLRLTLTVIETLEADLAAKDAEIERLKGIIEEAPHDPLCHWSTLKHTIGYVGKPCEPCHNCTCWKSEAR